MWSEISIPDILQWGLLIGCICGICGLLILQKKQKAKDLDKKRDSQTNLSASGAKPAQKATVRIGLPPKQGPDPLTPGSKQTIRISLPSKQGQVPVDPYETSANPIVPTQYTADELNEKKYGITGPAPLPIAHPGMLPVPIPINPGIPQVVFRMRILQQLREEQLVDEEEYQEKKSEILRNL